ncbi:MAG: alpha/beta fold hydrolase [Paracoccaceae bacterium]
MTLHRFGTGARQVLALHCSLAHGGVWAGLDLPGTALIAPDLPGHGARPLWDGSGDYHSECTRQALALARDHGPVDLIGHSSGATVALRVALEAPELTRTLTLIEPVLFAAARAAGDAAFARHTADFAPFGTALAVGDTASASAFFHRYWSGTEFASLPPGLQAYMTARINLIPAQIDVLMDDAAGLLSYMRLESLGIPVLLLEGATSPPIIAAIQTELARRLPQATRTIIPGAGHMLPITHRAEVSAAIAAHLQGTSSMM